MLGTAHSIENIFSQAYNLTFATEELSRAKYFTQISGRVVAPENCFANKRADLLRSIYSFSDRS